MSINKQCPHMHVYHNRISHRGINTKSKYICISISIQITIEMATVYLCQLLVFLLGRQVSSQDIVPVAYPAKVLEGSEQVCPPDEQLEMARAEIQQDVITFVTPCPGLTQGNPATSCLQISQCNPQLPSEFYWITSSNGTAIQIYCDMDRECTCSSNSAGGWSRVAYLNMTDPTQQCPPEWNETTGAVRACGRTNETLFGGGGCSSASFSTYSISYSHICGRIVAYQFGHPEAFDPYISFGLTRIEDPYVDGVVIVRGTEKHHVWTFAVENSESSNSSTVCPCTNAPNPDATIPPFVGEDYFCETATDTDTPNFILYSDDPLWDGENCGSTSTCCEFNDPPYFCQSLSEATADDIEVRICGDYALTDEDTPVELIEIFVQ